MAVYQVFPDKKRSVFKRISVTTWLIILNVLFFLVFYFLISLGVLKMDYIALNPSNIINHLYIWTFITSMFMHGGFFHLFVNMLSLFFVGNLLERILGGKRYFAFYIAAGIFSGLLFLVSSFIFTSDFNLYAVGASGAIFGLIGVLMFLTPNLPVYLLFIPVPVKMKYAAPGMLVLLWVVSIGLSVPIGNAAHLGGFLFGVFYGFYLRKKYPNKVNYLSKHFR
ncbi:MAG: rhomboid family intramembrane serine protease [archaeon]|nr:rhomboid family intramembrane serine protease [archaeon]